ncbi:Phosphatidylglycerol/phosphatidylinositol transfer protein [Xylographa bjoerkii]|nr:Phosphatidylglycerol/phosphatidylinositol transfer protein [Xylographa bjoerkii]
MKLTTYFASLALSSLATASIFGGQTVLEDADLSVPGDNPLTFCKAPDDDKLVIEYVDLIPNPPEAGKVLKIEAAGNFTEEIAEGAYVLLSVKYNRLITLFSSRENLCDQMKNVDKECPLEKGKISITKEVELPTRIPPGTYDVLADAYDANDQKLTCLTAKVAFKSV